MEGGRTNFQGPPGFPAAFRIEGSTLVVTDKANREVFRKQFPGLRKETYEDRTWTFTWFGDLDGRPGREALFVFVPLSGTREGTRLIRHGSDGSELWTFVPGRTVRDAEREFSHTSRIYDFAVHGSPPDARVLVTSLHELYYPNQLAVLNGSGGLLGEYWHSGHLPRLLAADLDRDGAAEVVLGGVNNSYRAATLISITFPSGRYASREPAGDHHQLQGFEPAVEKARFIFPRDLSEPQAR